MSTFLTLLFSHSIQIIGFQNIHVINILSNHYFIMPKLCCAIKAIFCMNKENGIRIKLLSTFQTMLVSQATAELNKRKIKNLSRLFWLLVPLGEGSPCALSPITQKRPCIYQLLPHLSPEIWVFPQYFWQFYATAQCNMQKATSSG